jgi:hypothetical protein
VGCYCVSVFTDISIDMRTERVSLKPTLFLPMVMTIIWDASWSMHFKRTPCLEKTRLEQDGFYVACNNDLGETSVVHLA